MSVVWIVTTGNSDVKLLTDKDFSFLKDTSVKEDLLGSCYTRFKPIKNDKDDFSLPFSTTRSIVIFAFLNTSFTPSPPPNCGIIGISAGIVKP